MNTKVYVRLVADSFVGSEGFYHKNIADICSTRERAMDMLWIWKDGIPDGAYMEPFKPSNDKQAIDGLKVVYKGIVDYCWIEEHEVL